LLQQDCVIGSLYGQHSSSVKNGFNSHMNDFPIVICQIIIIITMEPPMSCLLRKTF
jgi:hypothetical protein